ncbi:protein tyrosine/serine phosphatase [Chthoniobacter flavus Ellin428]|uniref:Protein tyrosine/serine phosphatase n=1 Tax=Chthoniobacter flavus Ellin428 TaxID=497964 RepID=B4CZ19_9BACT|nr:tyrosine-protein phosphatase [Chthoniobacter flavus]EDY20710.1 protein tyrosine/serine phosphatase [Chthoniobacter flavus Ellin428]TCO89608.1 hypothetical protein EV701_11344 [Chthoniobacter flavus]
MFPRFVAFLLIAGVAVSACAADPGQPVETQALHNVFKLDTELYSGNAPEDDAGFRELAKLGIKTIVTVDGTKPNVALAHRYGMRYVHLPFGYDGLPQKRGVELAKAVQVAEAEGPVYLHCHHGKHRAPTAAAVVCEALDGWSKEKAIDFLHQAGTAPDYAGLYRDVKAFRPPAAAELAGMRADFPEIAKTPPMVDTMVAIDQHCDALKAAQKAGWSQVPGHPGEAPAQTAVLMWELFRELARDPETKQRGEDYLAKLAEGEKAADALRTVLADATQDGPTRDAAFQHVTEACAVCHKAHRN